MQITIGDLQVVSLLQTFAATILSVAAIFQRAPFLFQSHDFLARTSMQTLVQLSHSQCHQQIVIDQVVGVATSDRSAVAARIAACAARALSAVVARMMQRVVVVRQTRRKSRSG